MEIWEVMIQKLDVMIIEIWEVMIQKKGTNKGSCNRIRINVHNSLLLLLLERLPIQQLIAVLNIRTGPSLVTMRITIR